MTILNEITELHCMKLLSISISWTIPMYLEIKGNFLGDVRKGKWI